MHLSGEMVDTARGVDSSLQLQARLFSTQLDLIAIRNDRLANRIALHLALGGGFPPAAAP